MPDTTPLSPPAGAPEAQAGEFVPCAAECMLPLTALGDVEGESVPLGLPPVVDAHVHLFEPRLFEAIWRWFETHGWPIRYKLHAADVVAFLKARGVAHVVALHYAHKPGMARAMNAAMAGFVDAAGGFVTGLATVLPGEPDAAAIVHEGFAMGLAGVKLHCHVQCFAADANVADPVYDACARAGKPLVMHAGREPKSTAYKVDTYAVCGAERTESVLRNFPQLKLCVPHLGADEFDAYERLLLRYDNLWLDTTMMLAEYFPMRPQARLLQARPDRIMYGTDFPNLPYAWDRELKKLTAHGVRDQDLPALLGTNARALFG
jgi:uncharacterized protein